jgi:hypothetical protein
MTDNWDPAARQFLERLDEAIDSDTKSFAAKKPPLARIRFMKGIHTAFFCQESSGPRGAFVHELTRPRFPWTETSHSFSGHLVQG